jgi:adenylate cyclase
LAAKQAPPDDRFKGKAVIIGGLLAFEDEHLTPPTPFPGTKSGRTAGAVIHAITLSTLLSQNFFQEPGGLAGGVFIFLAALLAVVLCFNRRPLPGAGLCLLEASILVVISIIAFDHLYVIRLMSLLFAVFLSYGATTLFNYYTKERKLLKIRARFASFVPDKIIDRIVDMDVNRLMDGEQREVALFFSDIRDFTPFAEKNRHDPTKIVNFLNRYHTEMTEIILAHNGTVSQLTGDGIFAFFGAPVEAAEPVWDAVQAAVRMRERLGELKEVWQEYGKDDLRIGIGIHVGHAIVGTMGSVKKMDYTAIGDNTNVASRIEGLTKKFREVILMSDAAFKQVEGRVEARSLGEAEIKGHSNITLYAIDGIRP